jgi:DNA-binding response OmpR family regulator
MRAMIIDDDLNDTRIAARVANIAGFEDVEACQSIALAIESIEQGLRGERPLPSAIVLDLNLGHESGYELLRNWRTTWRDSTIRIIVWSVLGERNRELCALFRVDAYVSKWEGESALHEALRKVSGTSALAI